MKELGVGIVGTGWVSGEHIRAFEKNPHTRVVALCGRTEESARKKAAQSGVRADIHADFNEMIARDDIQIISVCTTPHLHAANIIAAARAGKHIVMEKPVAMNIGEMKAIRTAVKKARVKTVTSFVLRWNPLFKTIRALLDDGAIGRVFYAEVDYFHGIGPWYGQYHWNLTKKSGGSSLLSAGCHAMDALLWFMGKKPVEVTALSVKGGGKGYDAYQYDPTQLNMIRFADGSIGKCGSCIECRHPYTFNILLVGDKGTIRNNQVYSPKFPGQTGWVTIPTILPDSGDVTHHPFQGQMDEFVDCIVRGRQTQTNIDNTYATHEVIFACDRSAQKRGAKIKLPLSAS